MDLTLFAATAANSARHFFDNLEHPGGSKPPGCFSIYKEGACPACELAGYRKKKLPLYKPIMYNKRERGVRVWACCEKIRRKEFRFEEDWALWRF